MKDVALTYSPVRANFGYAGWVAIDGLNLPGPLYVRVRPDTTGRLRIMELYLDASENTKSSIAARDVRALPFPQIEAMINAHSDVVLKSLRVVGPNLSTLATYFCTRFGNYARQIKERNWAVLNFADQV